MARKARKESSSGVYHVVLKGNDRVLFADFSDYEKFIDILKKRAERDLMEICAYCLFGEVVHLVLKEGLVDISESIKNITCVYAKWYNAKYLRMGKLFYDRYASEPIESDSQLLQVVAYAHRLPLKFRQSLEYSYSSYNGYLKKEFSGGSVMMLLDNSLVKFKELNNAEVQTKFLGDPKPKKLTDSELASQIKDLLQGVEQQEIDALDAKDFKALVHRFKKIEGAGIRQLARVLNLSKSYVEKA